MSLNGYLANHTSEDNAAFREMINDLEAVRRTRMAWCYEAEERAKKAIEPSKEDVPLAIESGEFFGNFDMHDFHQSSVVVV